VLFLGATQHAAISAVTLVFDALWRSGALQTRDRCGLGVFNGPGSAVHRFALHRVRERRLTRGNDG
jgi:hypothetical protein